MLDRHPLNFKFRYASVVDGLHAVRKAGPEPPARRLECRTLAHGIPAMRETVAAAKLLVLGCAPALWRLRVPSVGIRPQVRLRWRERDHE
jgi:hypothetical protein